MQVILKVKACCCACGDQQLEGIDFFETYSPVLHWTMDPLMLILENPISLKSKKADFTATFLHDILEEDDKVYVEMPLGFKQQGSNGMFKIICHKKSQTPHAFWIYLAKKLDNCGLPQAPLDPCLFIGKKVITN